MTVLRTMTDAEFDSWLADAIRVYAAEKVASGQWAADAALGLSRDEHAQLLPQGTATPDNHLLAITDDAGAAVGVLWFVVKTRFDGRVAYVYNVEIATPHRRQGHARRAIAELENAARELGLGGIALHVFGHNAAGRALYARLGFEPTSINLFKPLG